MATTTIQIDAFGDFYLPDGRNFLFISAIDACTQNILQACKMRLGEDQFNVSEGVDYLGTIFTPQQNFAAFRQSLIQVILNCPDVISVESLALGKDGDQMQFSAEVTSLYGTIIIGSADA